MTGAVSWDRPFEPGPVMVNPDRDAARAKIVRDALNAVADNTVGNRAARHHLRELAHYADDTTLATLGRMLR